MIIKTPGTSSAVYQNNETTAVRLGTSWNGVIPWPSMANLHKLEDPHTNTVHTQKRYKHTVYGQQQDACFFLQMELTFRGPTWSKDFL